MEHHGIARVVVGDVGRLHSRHAPIDQALDLEFRPVQDPLSGEALTDDGVDLRTQRVGGSEYRGARTLGRVEGEPEPRGVLAERLGRDLAHLVAQSLERSTGTPGLRVAHHLEQIRVALAQDLVHDGELHALRLEQPKRFARLHGAQLARVAHQHQSLEPQAIRDPHQHLHLHRADHRGLVDDHDGAAKCAPRLGEPLRVDEVAVARKEPLERGRLDTGLSLEHPGGAGRGRESEQPTLADALRDASKHRGLARAGRALHAYQAVAREHNGPHGVSLPLGQARCAEVRLERFALHERLPGVGALAHPGHYRSFRSQRALGHKRQIRAATRRLHEVSVAHQPGNRRVDVLQRMDAGGVSERHRAHLARREHRRALRHVLHRPPHDFEHGQTASRTGWDGRARAALPLARRNEGKSEGLRLRPPALRAAPCATALPFARG